MVSSVFAVGNQIINWPTQNEQDETVLEASLLPTRIKACFSTTKHMFFKFSRGAAMLTNFDEVYEC